MLNLLVILTMAALIGQAIVGLSFFISCIWEDEKRAAFFAGLQFAVMLALPLLFLYLIRIGFFNTEGGGAAVLIITALIGAGALFALVVKRDLNPKALKGTAGYIVGTVERFDERATVFARNRAIRPGSEQYKIFYAEHPEWESIDAARRAIGGPVGTPGTIDDPYHLPNISASAASAAMAMHLSDPNIVKPQRNPAFKKSRIDLSPDDASQRVKGYTRSLGAVLVGIAQINPLWIYSKRGEIFHENWNDWGRPIDLEHRFAVIFAVEMNFRMIAAAPHTPTSVDSQGRYAEGALIAAQLAANIANMGYSAVANHVRYYDALLAPLAVDAGLGEVGRLGYLITKTFGPRIRLGAVTTDLPLKPDAPVDIGVQDFCSICKKCAVCCPSNSIPMDDEPTVINGTLRWKLNAETCFDFWGKVGTGCNVCMRVCPWSHANTLPHRLIKEMVTRNHLSRRFFFSMDEIFYGRKPKPKQAPEWARYS